MSGHVSTRLNFILKISFKKHNNDIFESYMYKISTTRSAFNDDFILWGETCYIGLKKKYFFVTIGNVLSDIV